MLSGLYGAPNPAKRKALTSWQKMAKHCLFFVAYPNKRQARLWRACRLYSDAMRVFCGRGLNSKKLNKPDRTFRYGWMRRRYILMVIK
jgi:hypothetical protein